MAKGPTIIKHIKQFDINPISKNSKKGLKVIDDIKKAQILRVTSLEPILARGTLDHLIGFVENSDPPTLTWKLEMLENYTSGDLISVINFLENKRDIQTTQW